MNPQEISLGRHAPSIVNVVVEASKGNQEKYHYHAKSGRFKLAYKFSMPVPAEYGWIPETIAEDGHFLNAMVIVDHSTHPGYICEARPIGMLKRKDNNHHVICVLLGDECYASVQDISNLDVKVLREIVEFFEPYFELSGWLNRAEAIKVIEAAHERYIARREAHIAKDRENEAVSESVDETITRPDPVVDHPEQDHTDDQEEEEDAEPDN